MNPVSFRGTTTRGGGEKVTLSIGRLGVNGQIHTAITLCKGDCMNDDDPVEVIGTMVVDDNHLIEGLKLLFPNGELNSPTNPAPYGRGLR